MIFGVNKHAEDNAPYIYKVFTKQGETKHQREGSNRAAVNVHAENIHKNDTHDGNKAGIDKGGAGAADSHIVRNQKVRFHENF